MRLALVVALVLAGCGGTAKPADPLQQSAADQRIVVASVELRGVSEANRAAVTAIAGAQLVVGEELTEQRYDTAHKAILDYYYERGHVNVQLTWPQELETARGKTPIVLTIDEGPPFTISKLDVADVPDADRARYIALSALKPGDLFARSKLTAWMQAVGEAAPGKPIVVPETSVDFATSTISVTLALKNP